MARRTKAQQRNLTQAQLEKQIVNSARQFTHIEGTYIRVSKTALTKFKKGTYSYDQFVKSLYRHNEKIMRGPTGWWEDAGERWRPKSGSVSSQDTLNLIRASWRQQAYKMDKDSLLKASMKEIVEQSLGDAVNPATNKKYIAELKEMAMDKNLTFESFKWNNANQRLEWVNSDGETVWIKINNTVDDGYSINKVEYGKE